MTGAFYCKILKSITIPSSVKYIGKYAFSGQSKMEYIKYEGSFSEWMNIENPNNDLFSGAHNSLLYIQNEKLYGTVKLPDDISVLNNMLYNYRFIKNLVIPKSITSIVKNSYWIPSSDNYGLINCYYEGTSEQWNAMCSLHGSNIRYYYYSDVQLSGNYWHYVNGIPTRW